jgi:nitroreductase
MINGNVSSKSSEQLLNWNMRQAYIALGTGLVAAAEEQVDSTPMEGFDPDALDKILELKGKGLRSAVIMALGYRDSETDHLNGKAKVRRSQAELFVKLG